MFEQSCPKPVADERSDDRALVARVLAGDALAFGTLVDRHHASFLRLARACARGAAVAERVVNDCWATILGDLASFRFECSLRTWMLAVVVQHAMGHCEKLPAWRRGRFEPGTAHGGEVERFDEGGRWIEPPVPWDERRLGVDSSTAIEDAISRLPFAEQAVLTLRDVERLGADDTCAVLGIAAHTERALLHAARCRVRRALDERFCTRAGRQACIG